MAKDHIDPLYMEIGQQIDTVEYNECALLGV